MILLYIFFAMMYLSVGALYTRHTHAVTKYEISQKTRCDDACGSRAWSAYSNRVSYCNCGYLSGAEGPFTLMFYMFGWGLIMPVELVCDFLTGGTYEPKEVKAAREAREIETRNLAFEKRVAQLEADCKIRQ